MRRIVKRRLPSAILRKRAVPPRSWTPTPLATLSTLHSLTAPVLSQDRRFFHPLGELDPPRAYPRSSARIIVGGSGGNSFISPRVAFAVPSGVGICVRRKQRREVLHATGSVGRGKRVSSFRRRSWFSDVDC